MPTRLYLSEWPLDKMKDSGEEKFPYMRIDKKTKELIYSQNQDLGMIDEKVHCKSTMVLDSGGEVSLRILPSDPEKYEGSLCFVEIGDNDEKHLKEIENYFSPLCYTERVPLRTTF